LELLSRPVRLVEKRARRISSECYRTVLTYRGGSVVDRNLYVIQSEKPPKEARSVAADLVTRRNLSTDSTSGLPILSLRIERVVPLAP
jgi:hypothetical protein